MTESPSKRANGDYTRTAPKRREARITFAIVAVAALIIHLPLLFSDAYRGPNLDAQNAAQFGDFVGGYIGSLLSLVSVALLVITLRSQVAANQRESFESKYFEMIKLHRDNVAELAVGEERSRKVFVLLIRELRCIIPIVRNISDRLGILLDIEKLLDISYNVLYYGVGPNSSRMLKDALNAEDPSFVNELVSTLEDPLVKDTASELRNAKYKLFEGHQSRLGHYYRHLFQSVSYVDAQTIAIDKYDFVKSVRAQLSTHEQALLFVNSLTKMGRAWRHRKFIDTYRMCKNLPRRFFDPVTEIDLGKYFPDEYFEWHEYRWDARGTPRLDSGATN